ncbi:unnamed protein product [Pieris brassicae]|uniref:Uncharacterized protein n=1 Tax=Pieris brassicae TaxID=7116 RepID=A0A9P0SU27_PIEBR|nr:unnamed protein product [Pieris brassicae]
MSTRNLFGNLRIPDVDTCCGCVTDIKTAATIIAVLGIVTCPLVSWAVVRHAYVIRVSCIVTTSSTRADVIDINLNNILSFGFGANAGLGPSCIVRNKTETPDPTMLLRMRSEDGEGHSKFVSVVRFLGWLVLTADTFFLLSSINLLVKMFRGLGQQGARYFIIFGLAAVILSFIYGLLYVSACVYMGGSFPVFEFVFSLVDLIMFSMWLHFFAVVHTYSKPPRKLTPLDRIRKLLRSQYSRNVQPRKFGKLQ